MSTPTATHPAHPGPVIICPHDRQILLTWTLGPITDGYGQQGTALAELDVYHSRTGKALVAVLRPAFRHGAGTCYSMRIGQRSWNLSEPIARYSRRRLSEFAGTALTALRAADPAEIAYAFDPASGEHA